MKKVAYIGHSYHMKTNSTLFLRDFLAENFEVDFFSDDSWCGKGEPDVSNIGEEYHAVIFFQSISMSMLKQISCKNIIYIPMYDSSGENLNSYWYNWRNLKIVNFSSSLDRRLQKIGFQTLSVKYSPPLGEFIQGTSDSIFFWQRVNKISWALVKQVVGQNHINSTHIHRAIDPGQEFIKPSSDDETKYHITYSDWFETRQQYWQCVADKSIYIAPRWQEGIGMSFLEAMAMGKAVVAPNQPTMNEYIEHGYNGFLYDINKPKEIDFKNIKSIQYNAYQSIVASQQSWEKDKIKILEFIDAPNRQNYYFDQNPLNFNNDSMKQSAEYRQTEMNTLLTHAITLLQKGDSFQAEKMFRQIIQKEPKNFTVIYNLAVILYNQGNLNEAFIQCQVALTINPSHVQTLVMLGQLFHRSTKINEAIACYKRALSIAPEMAEVYNMLGAAYSGQGRANDTIACYRKAIQLNPNLERIHSILLLALNYSADIMPEEVFAEHKRWARKHALFPIIPHTNNNDKMRKIRVGYISQDFRRNSVGYFIEPIIAAHDHSRYEIFCYSNVIGKPDLVTEKFSRIADQWRDIRGMSDENIAKLIRQDGIDILVDLTGHTGHNSVLVSAYKPAPVQVTWLGYANTTGLAVVDYRITDNYADPVGMTERYFTEELVRMPHTFICYSPPDDSPDINKLPALDNGYITFGSFNILAKITPHVIATWSAILRRLPTAKLLMKDKSLSDSSSREYIQKQFAVHGIKADRIEMVGFEPSFTGHLAKYHHVDIVLDPYPYNGTTNTFDALWMGAPVITLAGNTHVSRVGVSILSNLGLSSMVANSEKEYVDIAVSLAYSLDYLQQARAGLRRRIMQSPLTDANRFTKALEEKYRNMWGIWCQRH